MISSLLLHSKTSKQLEQIAKRTPSSVLIVGPMGSGKETISMALSAEVLGAKDPRSYPYFLLISPPMDTISIEEIRSVQQFLRLKVPSESPATIRRVVLIVNAERMRKEAQNALLKTLEEPPLDTIIIMTSISSDTLLETIQSRTTQLPVLPVSKAAALTHFAQFPEKDVRSFYALSQGQVGLLTSLLEDRSHELISSVKIAKELFKLPLAARLLRTEELSKDKKAIQMLLNAMHRIAHAGLLTASTNNSPQVQSWHQKQRAILQSIEYAKLNANPKLLLDDLFLAI